MSSEGRSLRVAFVVPGFSAGEDDWCIPALTDLVKDLTEELDVCVFSLHYPFDAGEYETHGADVIALGGANRSGFWRAPLLSRALMRIAARHRSQPFDVVHGFCVDEPGFLAVSAGRLLGIPTLVSVLGGELIAMPSIDYGGQLSRTNRILTRQVLKRAGAVTCGSNFVLSQINSFDTKRTCCIPLGVDTSLFSKNAASPQVPLSLLHVGSLTPVKNQRLLLDMFRRIEHRFPELTLDIIGEGPLRGRLQRIIDNSSLRSRVRLHGFVPRPQLRDWYCRSRLLVLGSCYESQSLVALEAAACGTPTVGTAVGILPELLPPQYCTPPGEAEPLAQVIARLLNDDSEQAVLARHVGEMVVTRFGLGSTVASFMRMYRELIAENQLPGKRTGRMTNQQKTESQ